MATGAVKWNWEARTRGGEVRKGVMEGESQESVEARLKSQNLSVTKVKKKPKELSLAFGSPVTERELVVFVRQFATMINAGLPLVQSLEILSSQGDNKAFNQVLKDIKSQVEQGSTFSEALAKHPKIFDALFVNLVNAGEIGGILDTILQRLAVYIEKRVKLKSQVRGALVYPVSVGFIAGAVLVVMLVWVIPSFKSMFADFGGGSLPALTQIVIDISDAFVGQIFILTGAVTTISTLVGYSYKVPKGKRFWHRALLTLPIIGPVMRKIAVARFTRTLSTLLGSGVPILDAMNIVARSAGNIMVEEAINKTSARVREGSNMADPLMETKVFPSMVVQMIGVGEQTGALDQMLTKIADFYEDEVDAAVAGLTSLLEPIMMVGIGGMVGFLLIAMYLPIFSIADQVGGH